MVGIIGIVTPGPTVSFAQECGLGTAGEFNTFIFGDFTDSSDTEGRLAAGGNVNLSGYSVGLELDADQYEDILIVGGDLTFDSGTVHYGNVLVGGSGDGIHPTQVTVASGDIIIGEALPIDFDAEEEYLKALSTTLSQLESNGTSEIKWNCCAYLTGDGTSALQVFSLNGEDLLNASSFNIEDIPSGATVIFNVSGTTAGLTDMSLESLKSIRNKVLFNFYEATTLKLSGIAVQGSILAPFAHVDNPGGVIWGSIIAASWNGSMQQNHYPFTGDLPCEEEDESGSITVFKYNDLNENGQYDQESESGLEGWTFTIGDESQTTDSTGKATFDNLVAGQEYEVCETSQTGWINSDPSDGSGCKTVTAGSSSSASAETIVNADGNKYTIEFLGTSNDGLTWNYKVSETEGKSLSHWVLGLCVAEDDVVSWSPDASDSGIEGVEVVEDPTTGVFGIKWDLNDDYDNSGGEEDDSLTFSFTLDAAYAQGAVDVAVKTGGKTSKTAISTIIGPDCSASSTETVMFGNYQVEGAEITKYQRLDDSDDWTVDPLFGLQPGDTFSYQISVENLYYEEDLGMEIFDTLSDLIEFEDGTLIVEKVDTAGNTELVDDDDYDFTYDSGTRELALDYDSTLFSGETLKLSFDVMVTDGFGDDDVILNTAEVEFTGKDRIKSNTVEVYAVPEPGTIVLLGIGLIGLLGFGRKFRKN
jgi:choice-of-anchor A domain-containing protein